MQQDYFLRQVEQFGKVLATILSRLLGMDYQGTVINQIECQFAQEKLDLDIRELIGMETDELIATLKNEKQFTNEDIEKLTDILLLAAEDETDPTQKTMLESKCLAVYEYIQANSNSYSFELFQKTEKLRREASSR